MLARLLPGGLAFRRIGQESVSILVPFAAAGGDNCTLSSAAQGAVDHRRIGEGRNRAHRGGQPQRLGDARLETALKFALGPRRGVRAGARIWDRDGSRSR
jgi:hypothetical protein